MKKKEERKKLAYYISQLFTRQCKFIDRLKYSLRYRQCSKDGIEVLKIKTLNKYEIKIWDKHGGKSNGVYVWHEWSFNVFKRLQQRLFHWWKFWIGMYKTQKKLSIGFMVTSHAYRNSTHPVIGLESQDLLFLPPWIPGTTLELVSHQNHIFWRPCSRVPTGS